MINISNVFHAATKYCCLFFYLIPAGFHFEFLNIFVAVFVIAFVAYCFYMIITCAQKYYRHRDIPFTDTKSDTWIIPELYPIYYYDHIDIQLVKEQGSADGSLSVLLSEGNPNKLANLPPTEFSRIEEIELCLFELEKSLSYELQEFNQHRQHSRILLSLFFLRLRSICRGKSTVTNPGYRAVLKEFCHRILTAETFLAFMVDSNGDPSVLSFINDVAYFLGATLDSAYPDVLLKLCQLLELQENFGEGKNDILQYTFTVLVLQTLTESSITRELETMLHVMENNNFGENSRKMVSNCLTVVILSPDKQLRPMHLALIDRLLSAGLGAGWLSVRKNSATAFGNYQIFFPNFASRLKERFSHQIRDDLDLFMSVST